MFSKNTVIMGSWWDEWGQQIVAMIVVLIVAGIPSALFFTFNPGPHPTLLWIIFGVSLVGTPLILVWEEHATEDAVKKGFMNEWMIFERIVRALARVHLVDKVHSINNSKVPYLAEELTHKLRIFDEAELAEIQDLDVDYYRLHEADYTLEHSRIRKRYQTVHGFIRQLTHDPRTDVGTVAQKAARQTS